MYAGDGNKRSVDGLEIESVHAYGEHELVDIEHPEHLSPERLSQLTAIENADIVAYRSWMGSTDVTDIGDGAEGYYIVSFQGPIDQSWTEHLTSLGMKIVDTAAPFSVVVRANGEQLQASLTLPLSSGRAAVRGINKVPNAARLAPDVMAVAEGAMTIDAIKGLRMSENGSTIMIAVPYADANPRRVMRQLRRIVEPATAAAGFGYENAFEMTPAQAWQALNEVEGLAWLELLHERRPMNNLAAKSNVQAVEDVWNSGYTGAGVAVNHNDGGIDLNGVGGVTAFPSGTVTATAGNHSGTDNAHGTHTAGSVAGRPISVAPPASTSGCGDLTPALTSAKGMAYGATLNSNNLFDPGTTGKTTEDDMMKWGQDNASQITTNSWGYTNSYTYSSQSVTIDRAVRDADTTEAGNQALCAVFAAGNDGSGAGTVGMPGNGKNVLTVGASYNVRCGSYTSGAPGTLSGNLNTVVDFSGRGPSQGRIKPDIVATGANVLSVASDDSLADHSWDQTWTGANYELMPGTSMACPIAAGATAVFYQYYKATQGGAFPSPALAKASMINGAVAMSGYTYENTATGAYAQGWGRLNLKNSVQGPTGGTIRYIEQGTGLTTGGSNSRTITVNGSSVPLKITLVWTDPQGTAGSSAPLVNNLDLVVTAPNGTVYRGNKFTGLWSTANPGASADTANNVENVFVQSPATGAWTIEVRGTSVPTNVTGMTGQDFAMAWSGNATDGGTPTPNFSLSASPSSATVAPGSPATSTITSAVSGGFNASVALTASGLPAGATASFSPASFAAPGSGTSTMTITTSGSTPVGVSTITVTGTGGSLTRTTTFTLTVEAPGVATPIACGASADGALATTDGRGSVRGATFYADNYSFTPSASGTATISMSSSIDTYLVLKSSLEATAALAQDDDSGDGTNSLITYTVTAGTTYYIEATSYSANTTGAYTLALTCPTSSCTYSISPTSASPGAGASTGTVAVTAGTGCAWTATSNAAWLTITSGASGSGNGSVGYSVAANTDAARTGTMTIAGQTFTVNQASGCTYSISPTSASPAAGATTGTVSVTGGAGCAWTATSNAAWLTITSGASGSGNGSVGYSVAENTGAARSGTLTIAGQTFTVNQAAAASCTYSISPTSASPAAGATTGTVSVTAGAGCAWTATSNAAWLTITSGASGSGNGSVGYSVAVNTGAPRSGTLTIAGQTFTVNQAAGATCSSSTTAIVSGTPLTQSLATTDCTTTAGNGTATNGYYDTFTFSGTSGQSVTITNNSTAFDAFLRLNNPSGTLVASDDDSNGGTNSKITYTLAATGTFTILATSYAGGSTGSYTVALTISGTTTTVLSEGAESGASGWTVSTNVTGNNWIVSTAGRYTGTNGFRSNQASTAYPNNLDQSLISPAFSLAGKTSASLAFRSKYQTEATYDYFKVEISTNGGTSWTALTSGSGLNGTSSGWQSTAGVAMLANTYSLNSYAGQANVKIRFRLTSDASVQKWGVAVDDIAVTAQ
ncbi:MAG: S8 family serine peptidase [Blastocatellia bacterium]|nr:S8 family serine peptidase [Blastocatellia bacterium]